MSDRLAELARIVDDAARHARAIPQLSLQHAFDIDDAYEIQALSIERRLARGERMVGMKMGFTSRAKMRQMGLDELIWGRLTSQMMLEDGGTLSLSDKVHPRVEPEIAFLLAKPLEGQVTPAQALAAVEAVAPAMEVIDSRYENFRFSLPDVVADNSSSSGFVVGAWSPRTVDLSNLGLVVEIDGRVVEVGSSAAILGHPVRSLVAAARLAAASELRLEAGWIVLAGGATAATALKPGHVRVVGQHLGQVNLTVTA